jgi:hypothetical protein
MEITSLTCIGVLLYMDKYIYLTKTRIGKVDLITSEENKV